MIKKIITGAALVFAFMPVFAFATTNIGLSTTATTVAAGQSFTLTINVNPGSGDTAYTSKIVLSYPADIVTPTSFALAPAWIALSEPGYDAMSGGSVIKTAGYPDGITTSHAFGTVTFTALKSGTATVTVTSGTQVWDGTNQNIFSGVQTSAHVTITGSAPAVTPSPTPAPVVTPAPTATAKKASVSAPAAAPAAPVSSTVTGSASPTSTTSTVLATASTTSTAGSSVFSYIIGIIILIVLGGGFFIWRKLVQQGL